jgi:hypothetical protein
MSAEGNIGNGRPDTGETDQAVGAVRSGQSGNAERGAAPPLPKDLGQAVERLDALLGATQDLERLRMGMGIRLALGMAQELRDGVALGSRTGDMVAAWAEEHGSESVDMAVRIAREFLTKPDELRKALGQRLGLDGQATSEDSDGAGLSDSVEVPEDSDGPDERDGSDGESGV